MHMEKVGMVGKSSGNKGSFYLIRGEVWARIHGVAAEEWKGNTTTEQWSRREWTVNAPFA